MIVGKSTQMFADLEVGEVYKNIVGPLGQPTHIEKKVPLFVKVVEQVLQIFLIFLVKI